MAEGQHAVERSHPPDAVVRVVNPILRGLLSSPVHGLVSSQLMLLHFTGRKSGERYTVPVGHHHLDGRLAVLTNSNWRVNFRDGAHAEVTYQGRRQSVRATLEEDPETVAKVYEGIIDELGVKQAQRRLGITLNVEREPSHKEMVDAVRCSGLSILYLDPESQNG
jgi:hypothetical protein